MPKTTVINLKDAPEGWEQDERFYYIGRWTKYHRDYDFGNPYIVYVHGNRETCIRKHEKDFRNRPTYRYLVWKYLMGKILVCHCKPEACHGDTYALFLNDLKKIKSDADLQRVIKLREGAHDQEGSRK